MKKFCLFFIFLFASLRLLAQVDYLEPFKPVSLYSGELGAYARGVFKLLNSGLQSKPYARYYAIPSFSPEYALSVEKKNGICYLISNTLSRSYWYEKDKDQVHVLRRSVRIQASLYQVLGDILRKVTSEVQDMDGTSMGLDGMVYYFSAANSQGKVLSGRKWSPDKGTLMSQLVMVCESAYRLSVGDNISEEELIRSARMLWQDLQARSKSDPEGYRRPVYQGIYSVGVQPLSLSGRHIDTLPRFSAGSADEYVASRMVYPASLLAQKEKGYVLCEFTIHKSGSVLRPHILQASHPEFAEEVLRIVKGMPDWIPARTGDKAQDVNYVLYVPFRPSVYLSRPSVSRKGGE